MTIKLHGEVKAIADANRARSPNVHEEWENFQDAMSELGAYGAEIRNRLKTRGEYLIKLDKEGKIPTADAEPVGHAPTTDNVVNLKPVS